VKLNLLVRTLTIGNIKPFLTNLECLHSCGPLAYFDKEHAKQLLYALDDSVWGKKITAVEESTDFV
jgi:hypothetical protein